MGKGRKSTLIVTFHGAVPPDFPVPWWRDQGKRHRVFVTGLLPGTLAGGHLLSSKSTLHVVFMAELGYHSCLAPRHCGHSLLKPRVTLPLPSPLPEPTERAQEESNVCKDRDQPHTVGLWGPHVASHFGQVVKSHDF